jgi:hypothetical protein
MGIPAIRSYSGATVAAPLSPLTQRPGAAEVARGVNTAICELEDRLDLAVREHLVGFFCECGCLGTVPMTMTAYRLAGGAWLDGHQG